MKIIAKIFGKVLEYLNQGRSHSFCSSVVKMCIFTLNTLRKCDKRNNRDKHAIANVAYFDFDSSEELYREFGHLDMKRFLTLMTIVAAVAPVQRS